MGICRQAFWSANRKVEHWVRLSCGVLLQVESLDKAFGLLEEMNTQGVPADNSTYGTLMNLCAEAKQGHRAYQLMQVCLTDGHLSKSAFAPHVLGMQISAVVLVHCFSPMDVEVLLSYLAFTCFTDCSCQHSLLL